MITEDKDRLLLDREVMLIEVMRTILRSICLYNRDLVYGVSYMVRYVPQH